MADYSLTAQTADGHATSLGWLMVPSTSMADLYVAMMEYHQTDLLDRYVTLRAETERYGELVVATMQRRDRLQIHAVSSPFEDRPGGWMFTYWVTEAGTR